MKANFLASPPLVVAYALAGTVDIDLATEPVGTDKDGNEVFLKELWPTTDEIAAEMDNAIVQIYLIRCMKMYLNHQLGKKFQLVVENYLAGRIIYLYTRTSFFHEYD